MWMRTSVVAKLWESESCAAQVEMQSVSSAKLHVTREQATEKKEKNEDGDGQEGGAELGALAGATRFISPPPHDWGPSANEANGYHNHDATCRHKELLGGGSRACPELCGGGMEMG
jgi:hypothetical protein